MLATHHDRENLVFSHQAGAALKQQQLQSKTPGTRYPKTPLKVPLNDENTKHGLGKSVFPAKGGNENLVTGGKSTKVLGKQNAVTPLEPRTGRAPLGNKTTNAKAKAVQQGTVKNIVQEYEKTNAKPTTVKRQRQAPAQLEPAKLEIHADKSPLNDEEDVEYAPPQPKDLPYKSDIIPDGALTFEGLKPENMFKGYYEFYFNPVDENGVSRKEKELEERRQRAFKDSDDQIRREVEEFKWSIGESPKAKETLKVHEAAASATGRNVMSSRPVLKPLGTITSRRAASALSMASRSGTAKTRKPLSPTKKQLQLPVRAKSSAAQRPPITRNSTMDHAVAQAASRSTLGYSKGRIASTSIHNGDASSGGPRNSRSLARSASAASCGSDMTITPARFAHHQASKSADWKTPEFLSIFDGEDDDDDDQLGGAPILDDVDEDFQLQTDF